MAEVLTDRDLAILRQMYQPLRADWIEATQADRRRLKKLGMIEFRSDAMGSPTRWRLTPAGEWRATEVPTP